MFEVVFRVTYEGETCNLTRRFPSLKMLFWCNKEHDVTEVIVRDPDEYSLFIREVPKPEGTMGESSDNQSFHLITRSCTCMEKLSVVKLIGDLDILHVSPSMAEKGWEYHRVVLFKHEDLEELMKRLGKAGYVAEVLRKVPFDGFIAGSLTLNADALFSDLTDKQVEALLTAHRLGYYRFPRKADAKTIAARKNVPRTTFCDSLRKAECKVISALVPYMQLFAQAPNEKKVSLKLKHTP